MQECEIRIATLADAPAIEELSVQLGYASSQGETVDRLKEMVESTDHGVFVACAGKGMVVGWVHVFKTLRVESNAFSELGGFVVDEHHRGQGIGRMLLGAAEEWALARGLPKLRVRTRSGRAEAHAFYEQRGFSLKKEQYVYDKSLGPER
jgi:GNAT superfamily N-acetyltransferase